MNICVNNISAAVIATITLLGCAQPPQRTLRPATDQDIMIGVIEPGQQRLWKAALASNTLPPVNAIKVPADPVESVSQVRVPETQQWRAPTLPEGVATAVVPVSLPRMDGYFGRAQVLKAETEKLTLLLKSGQRLELAYRSPSRVAVERLLPQTSAMVEVLKLPTLVPASRYGLAIGDEGQAPALVVLQDSGDRPIRHQFRVGDITISQASDAVMQRMQEKGEKLPASGVPVPVLISIGKKSATYQSGAIVDASESGIGYDVVVYESRMYPAEAAYSDTPPFSLHVGIFAPGPR
ncbi:MAG: hypothetical protein ABW092_09270 [Candidatus Thiodiazotropha sp.]